MRTNRGWTLAALLTSAAAITSTAIAQPTLDEDLGALTNGVLVSRTTNIGPSIVRWYKFTVPAVPSVPGGGQVFLDIRTTNPSGVTLTDTEIGLYDASGNFASGALATSTDDDDGPGLGSSLSYGGTCPTRANPLVSPNTTTGVAFNGRDGALAAGDYYLAVVRFNSTFATPWAPTVPTTGTPGDMVVEILLGTTEPVTTLPPNLTAGPAVAADPGGTTLVTVTAATTCDGSDLPNSMTLDLSAVGGSSAVTMFDNGTNGDATAGDNTWSANISVPGATAPGSYTLVATATNPASLTATRNVTLSVAAPFFPVKISQVNGGGGGQGASGPNCDYVELYNSGATTADLTGYSVQIATATGTTWTVVPMPADLTVPAGAYALVQIGTPSATGIAFSPDAAGAGTSLSTTGGKVAVVRGTAALSGACPIPTALVTDFVGYGTTASCREGASTADNAPPMGATGNAIFRRCNGSVDTQNNLADFRLATWNPRNLSSPPPPPAADLTVTAAASPSSVAAGGTVVITASAVNGCGGTSTGQAFTADLTTVGGPSSQTMLDNGVRSDAVANDGTFTTSHVIPAGTTIGGKSVPVRATDAGGGSGTGPATFSVVLDFMGACCIGNAAYYRTSTECATGGGAYQGDNSSPFSAPGVVFPGNGTFPITDLATVNDTITVSNTSTISSVVVNINLTHTFLGDLIATISNGTTTVSLFNRPGTDTSNMNGVYSFYDNGASLLAEVAASTDTNYVNRPGYYSATGAAGVTELLSQFNGQSAAGNWTITISDNANIDTGSFSWSLEINPTDRCAPTCGSADFDGDGDVGTDADIEAFFACLGGNCCATCGSSDFDGDGDVGTDADIEAFFRILGGGSC